VIEVLQDRASRKDYTLTPGLHRVVSFTELSLTTLFTCDELPDLVLRLIPGCSPDHDQPGVLLESAEGLFRQRIVAIPVVDHPVADLELVTSASLTSSDRRFLKTSRDVCRARSTVERAVARLRVRGSARSRLRSAFCPNSPRWGRAPLSRSRRPKRTRCSPRRYATVRRPAFSVVARWLGKCQSRTADEALEKTDGLKDVSESTLKEQPLPGTPQHVVDTLAPRFGHSFGDVKILTGAEANARTATLGAPAMAIGKSIYLSAKVDPSSPEGRKLRHPLKSDRIQRGKFPAAERCGRTIS